MMGFSAVSGARALGGFYYGILVQYSRAHKAPITTRTRLQNTCCGIKTSYGALRNKIGIFFRRLYEGAPKHAHAVGV